MHYAKENLQQGLTNQEASAETPESFATIDGASQPREGVELSKGNSRMAGEMGARALELMNNPNEQKRVQGWMNRFGITNQGMEWNQAKMGTSPQE